MIYIKIDILQGYTGSYDQVVIEKKNRSAPYNDAYITNISY